MNWVYMLRCGDGTLYTGWTNDLEKRLRTHQAGKGGRYTRAHLPVELAYAERCATAREARSREQKLKRLKRAEKLALIREREAEDETGGA